jgi:hypothetical protein
MSIVLRENNLITKGWLYKSTPYMPHLTLDELRKLFINFQGFTIRLTKLGKRNSKLKFRNKNSLLQNVGALH